MADCYYLDGARNQQGPVPADEIARLIRGGTIRRDTLIWHAGMPDWRPAGQVNEFASLFAQTPPTYSAPWHADSFEMAVVATFVFGLVGIIMAIVGFKVFDLLTWRIVYSMVPAAIAAVAAARL